MGDPTPSGHDFDYLRGPDVDTNIRTIIDTLIHKSDLVASAANDRLLQAHNTPIFEMTDQEETQWKEVFPEIPERIKIAQQSNMLLAADIPLGTLLLPSGDKDDTIRSSDVLQEETTTKVNLFYQHGYYNTPLLPIPSSEKLRFFRLPRISAHYDLITQMFDYRHTTLGMEIVLFTSSGLPVVAHFTDIESDTSITRIFGHYSPGDVNIDVFNRTSTPNGITFTEFRELYNEDHHLLGYHYDVEITCTEPQSVRAIPIPGEVKSRFSLLEIGNHFLKQHEITDGE